MPSNLPDKKTLEPSRVGLCYHEQLSDAFLHAALIFGFENDANFVTRVAALSYCNGVDLVMRNPLLAAECAERILCTLELGRTELEGHTARISAQIPESDTLSTIRKYFRDDRNAGALRLDDPDDVLSIRQIIAEAVALGMYSRSLTPDIYLEVKGGLEACKAEQYFLTSRLSFWMVQGGLPKCYPLLELCDEYYQESRIERELMRGVMAEILNRAQDKPDPWNLDLWLATAWQFGNRLARMAPDIIDDLQKDVGPENWAINCNIYDHCLGG